MLAALSGGKPDVVPVAPCYLGIYLRPLEWQAYAHAYRLRLGPNGELALSPPEDNEILFESRVRALAAWPEMPDWIGVARGPSAEQQRRTLIRARGGELFLVDRQQQSETALSALAAGESNSLLRERVHDLSASESLSQAAIELRVPIVPADELLASGSFDVARRMVEHFGGHTFVHAIISTPYTSAKYVTGLYPLLCMMKSERQLLLEIIDRCLQAAVEQVRVWAALGVHGLWLQETLSSADMISPSDYDTFVYPTTRQLVRECQALGMKAILYVAGDVTPRLPCLAEMAPDALAVEESKKGFTLDIGAIRAAVGPDLCLFGNLDAYGVLERGSDDELRTEIARQLHAARADQGAFVMGIGSPITPATPPARVATFIRMCRDLGRYPMSWDPEP